MCAPEKKDVKQARGCQSHAYLTQPSGCMDISLDAIEHRTVVLQQDTIGVAATALERFGVVHRRGQDVEVIDLSVAVDHAVGTS